MKLFKGSVKHCKCFFEEHRQVQNRIYINTGVELAQNLKLLNDLPESCILNILDIILLSDVDLVNFFFSPVGCYCV